MLEGTNFFLYPSLPYCFFPQRVVELVSSFCAVSLSNLPVAICGIATENAAQKSFPPLATVVFIAFLLSLDVYISLNRVPVRYFSFLHLVTKSSPWAHQELLMLSNGENPAMHIQIAVKQGTKHWVR